ncbi:hypothetical protein, partial [Lactococcus lactis]|uniref:hypothetical protein n=1 Tax=Lactococcus lactis TaxID=1358 RepID=UPI002108DC4B
VPTNLERMKYVLSNNPKLLVKAAGKILRKTRIHFHPLKSLQLQINNNKRKKTRRFNNYENPKRLLIYDIYENQPQL